MTEIRYEHYFYLGGAKAIENGVCFTRTYYCKYTGKVVTKYYLNR